MQPISLPIVPELLVRKLPRAGMCLLLALFGSACLTQASVLQSPAGPDAGSNSHADAGPMAVTPGGANTPGSAVPVPAGLCARGGTCISVANEIIDEVDLVFVIDNSAGMEQKQRALREAAPQLFAALTSGDIGGDDTRDFAKARALHVSAVTSDMGLAGLEGVTGCNALGDDGVFVTTPRVPAVAGQLGCQSVYPPFALYLPGLELSSLQDDFSCLAAVGETGCRYTQPLEAALKGLWPAQDPTPLAGENRVRFLLDGTLEHYTLGHGDQENQGFLRRRPGEIFSVLAVVALTDKDDCSLSNVAAITATPHFEPRSNTVQRGAVSCLEAADALYMPQRYAAALRALRPERPELTVFAALAGVPPEWVSAERRRGFDFGNPAQRDEFYRGLLAEPRMQPRIDTRGTPALDDDAIVPVCDGALGTASPAARIVQVAQQFGAGALVQSACGDDYRAPLDAVAAQIGTQLGARCLPRPIKRDKDGRVACDVIWRLPSSPSPGAASLAAVATRCSEAGPFLTARDPKRKQRDGDRALCQLKQLPVVFSDTARPDDRDDTGGWYYDDFSATAQSACQGSATQLLAYTSAAVPPPDVDVFLDCAH